MDTAPLPHALALDANVFFRQSVKQLYDDLESATGTPPALFMTPEVRAELRDQKTRQYFASAIPYEIQVRSATSAAMTFVSNFAKKTGDFKSLSDTDLSLLALCYDLTQERGQLSLLNKAPKPLREAKPASMRSLYQKKEFDSSSEEDEAQEQDDGWNFVGGVQAKPEEATEPIIQEKAEEAAQEQAVEEGAKKENEIEGGEQNWEEAEQEQEQDEDDSCDEEWITAENMKEQLEKANEGREDQKVEEARVTMATADYAMQNVGMQIGIPVVSSETGMKIKKLRTYCLICKSCSFLQKSNDREFCSECGNHNLRKASLYVHRNGEVTYFINPLRRPNARGTKVGGL